MKRYSNGRFIKKGKCARLEILSEKIRERATEPVKSEMQTENEEILSAKSGWGDGRRIVELGHLSEQLKSCKNCTKPLLLHNIQSEKRIGYASILYIGCECGILCSVTTGKSHRPPGKTKKGMPVYDINTKAVLGVLHSGITYRQINGLMATMGIKGLHHSAMMRRREEIHPHIQDVANESCSAMLKEEVDSFNVPSTSSDENPSATSEPKEGIFKYDMGWQKRGSGRAYDSKSGVGTLIGNASGGICAFGVRISDCRMCTQSRNNGNEANIPPHNCVKNWSGSSKAMEPDVGVDLIKSVEEKGITVKTIIMDDDTTTMARIRNELPHTITKWSDINHTSKHLTNSLFSLQKKHKCLNNNVIAYLKKCFNYALAQTKGNVEQCRLQIEQIVPHSFGVHERCGEWCSYNSDPATYRHSTLIKDLSGEELRRDLEAVFNVFSQNAEKIAPGGSTKDVESFNNMISSKAPKRCHFSASGNLLSRVGCAVAHKNLGNKYISSINERVGLSPGKTSSEEASRRDSERKRQNLYYNKKENKLRKLQNKLKKRLQLSAKEKREGTTYKSGIATTTDIDESVIPPPSPIPRLDPVNNIDNIVFCDIETGSLHKDCDILQIAACVGGKSFNQYIRPKKPLSPAASKVTGLTSQGGVLFLNGSPVLAVPLKDALLHFIAWLNEIGPVVLVGHNFKVFDFPRLIRAFRAVSLQEQFETVCLGGIDTLPLFKSMYPDAEKHKQEYLFEMVLKEKYCAHNALDDVISLEKLLNNSSPPTETLLKHSFTTTWGFQHQIFQETVAQISSTFVTLLDRKVVSKLTVTKIASSGLCYNHLQTVFLRDSEMGLQNLLSERVKLSKRVVDSVKKHFLELGSA